MKWINCYGIKSESSYFCTPALLLFTVVLFVPICQSIYYSFCEYKGLTAPEFIGLENYKNLFKDKSMVFALEKFPVFPYFLLCFTAGHGIVSGCAPYQYQKGAQPL